VANELRLIRDATAAADARLLASGIDPSSWSSARVETMLGKDVVAPASGSSQRVDSRQSHVVNMVAEDVRRPLLQ
jgi:hypothetical protein